MTSFIEVTLRSVDHLDDFEERKILLSPSKRIPVGRSSKNATKNLLAAADNAFINSPVISREHATFSIPYMDDSLEYPPVYIADNGSMHGTYVNGSRLQSGMHRLSNGDTLRFGDDVVRDQDSFIAKSYRFSYRRAPVKPDHSFPRGISVPDTATSDDEEDIEVVEPLPQPRSYGSEANPVNIDDFEDASNEAVPFDVDDTIVAIHDPPSVQRPTEKHGDEKIGMAAAAPPLDEVAAKPGPTRFDLTEDDSSGEEDDEQDYPDEESDQSMNTSDDESEIVEEDESVQGSIDDSDVESVLDSGASDCGQPDADKVGNPRRSNILGVLNEENQRPKTPVQVNVESNQTSPAFNVTPPYAKLPQSQRYYQPAPMANFAARPIEQDKLREMEPNNLFSDPYVSSWENAIGASMSRPSAPRPTNWDSLNFVTPVLMREGPQTSWFDDAPPTLFPSNDYGRDSLSGFNRTHAYIPYNETTLAATTIPKPQTPYSGSPNPEEQGHQPADMPSASIPDPNDVAENDVPQTSRTGVSIAEIVETAPEQPPTPTSVSSPPSRKRKAEELEEPSVEETLAAPTSSHVVEASPLPPTEEAKQPTRKKARRSLGPVASGMAGFVLGGVAVISALLWTPEQVFEQMLS